MSNQIDEIVKNVLEYSQGLPDGIPDARLESMALRAVNNARKWAERQHDFQLSLVSVKGVVPATGAGLAWAGELEDFYGELVGDVVVKYKLKGIQTVYILTDDGAQLPIHHMRKNRLAQDVREDVKYGYEGTSAGLVGTTYCGYTPQAYFHGPKMFLNPSSEVDRNVVIDGFRWMGDYELGGTEDFFVEHGGDFLLWQGVIELNHITKYFVQRQEGNLPPPTGPRDLAWQSLLLWDDFMVDGGRQPDLD